jgi:hypothetical protein
MKQIGPAPEGLAVWQKTTSTLSLPGAAPHNFESVSEVTELFEGALPDKLFQLPDGYQQVTNLPYAAARPEPRTWAELTGFAKWERIWGRPHGRQQPHG